MSRVHHKEQQRQHVTAPADDDTVEFVDVDVALAIADEEADRWSELLDRLAK